LVRDGEYDAAERGVQALSAPSHDRQRCKATIVANQVEKGEIAGRSQRRLATFSLPTHREVVAAAFGLPLWCPSLTKPPAPVRTVLRVCIPRRRDYESIYCRCRIAQEYGDDKRIFMHMVISMAHQSPPQ
jgi:hypothetical protein